MAHLYLRKTIVFIHSYTSFKIPGEQDTEAVKPGKKTLETVKGVSLIKPLSGYSSK